MLRRVFGGIPRVNEYGNVSETRTVSILSCPDRPVEGVTSYSIIRLSDNPMPWVEQEFPARLELAGGCKKSCYLVSQPPGVSSIPHHAE
jgi:hypothetical protein